MTEKGKTLAEARARKADREAARQAAAEALELEALELEEAEEAKGKREGVDFEVVTTLVGNFVVQKPDFLTAKRFVDKKTQDVEDVVAFVTPNVTFPERSALGGVFQEHAGIAHRLTVSLLRMYEAAAKKRAGE